MTSPTGPYHTFLIPGEEITWAGDCPWTNHFCFGTASGKLVFLAPGDSEELAPTSQHQVSTEAVSDVAFWSDLVGIATPRETLLCRGPHTANRLTPVAVSPDGARQIIVTPRGRFLAHLAQGHLACCDAQQEPSPSWTRLVQDVHGESRLVYLGERDHTEILACAAGVGGLARIEIDAESSSRVASLSAPAVNLMDVCRLRSEEWPFAVVGLSRDGSLVLVRDLLALSERSPIRLQLKRLRGVPRGLFAAQGRLLVLTDEELVVYPDLSSRLLAGETLDPAVDAFHSPAPSARAFVAGERDLLVVTDDGVRVSEVLPASPAGFGSVSRVSKVKVMDWTVSRQTLRTLPTQWETRVD